MLFFFESLFGLQPKWSKRVLKNKPEKATWHNRVIIEFTFIIEVSDMLPNKDRQIGYCYSIILITISISILSPSALT